MYINLNINYLTEKIKSPIKYWHHYSSYWGVYFKTTQLMGNL